MSILGLDPGVRGAMALLRDKELRVWDMPTIDVRGKLKLNEGAFVRLVDSFADEVTMAWVEHVSARPDQGVTSMFSFGQVYGAQRMALTACEITYMLVRPNVWKMSMGCGANKESSLAVCLREFGSKYRHLWFGERMGILDGRCEAALLALYGSRQ